MPNGSKNERLAAAEGIVALQAERDAENALRLMVERGLVQHQPLGEIMTA